MADDFRRVVLVCGPPAAGKSTFVRRRAAAGDRVVDLDAIAAELGSPNSHDHPDDIRSRARVVRSRREAEVAAMPSGTAWVIRSAPSPQRRADLARRLGATQVIVFATPAETARERALTDNRPVWTGPLIDQWWSRYRPAAGELVITPKEGT